jgi:hypothetical protein
LRSSVAAVLLILLAGWAGWTAQHRFGHPPGAASVIASADAAGSDWAAVTPSAFDGIPAATAAKRLHSLGLRTWIQPVTAPGQRRGIVVRISPEGKVSPHAVITLYEAVVRPSSARHAPGTAHSGGVLATAHDSAGDHESSWDGA